MTKRNFLLSNIVFLLLNNLLHAQAIPPACTDDNTLMALIDRPSVGFSPCTVANKRIFIESGYDYQKIIPIGNGYSLPQTEIRIGTINNTEIDIFPSSYQTQTAPKQSGFNDNSIGIKHVLFFNKNQLFTVQGYVTPPSGNQYFGTTNTSYLLNAIYNYNFDSGLGVYTTVGFASNSSPPISPTKNFYSFNPIIDIGWSFGDKLSAYLEFYSESKTAIDQGWGVSMDGGFIFLTAKNVTLDVSAGQRICGFLDNIDHYFGAGIVVAFGL